MANPAATAALLAFLVVSAVSYRAHGAVIEADVIIIGAGACGTASFPLSPSLHHGFRTELRL